MIVSNKNDFNKMGWECIIKRGRNKSFYEAIIGQG